MRAGSGDAKQIVLGAPATMDRALFGESVTNVAGNFVVLRATGVRAIGVSKSDVASRCALQVVIASDCGIRGVPRSVGLSPVQSEREEGIEPI